MRQISSSETSGEHGPGPSAQRQIVALLLGLHLSACSAPAPTAAPSGAPSDPSLAQIDRLIGVAACHADEQCRVAEIGWRPCGGADSHRAWSTKSTDAKALQALLDRYREKRRGQRTDEGLQSNCLVLPQPAAWCAPLTTTQAGRCQLQEGAGIK